MMTNTRELVEEGRRYFESQSYRQAEECFLQLLDKKVEYADVFNMLGVIYHADGKFNDAILCFRNALKINPEYTEAILNLAVLLNDLGDTKEAKALYNQIPSRKKVSHEINPTLKGKIANMHREVAETYAGIGLHKEAIEEYKKALALCPGYKDIRTKLGISYRENREIELAVKELSETVKEYPGYLPARIQLGLTHYTGKMKEKAAREWNEVLKRDPQNTTARIYLKLCEDHKK